MVGKKRQFSPFHFHGPFHLCFLTMVVLVPLIDLLPFDFLRETAFVAYYPKLLVLQAGVFCLWITSLPRQRHSLPSAPFVLPVVLYLVFAVLSISLAVNRVEALLQLSHQVTLSLLFLAILNRVKGRDLFSYLWVVVAQTAIVAWIGLMQYVGWGFLEVPSSGLPSATLGYRNFAAMVMILSIPLGALLFLRARTTLETCCWGLALALMTTFLIATRTRGAWIGLLLACALALIFTVSLKLLNRLPPPGNESPLWSREKSTVAVAGLLLGLGFSLFVPPSMGEFGYERHSPEKVDVAGSVTSIFEKDSDKHRLNLWRNTLRMLYDHPAGVGIGNWQFNYPLYDEGQVVWKGATPRRPHNDYLWIASELGFLGLFVFLWILARGLLSSVNLAVLSKTRSEFWVPVSLGVSLLALAGHAFVSFPRERVSASMLFWIVLAFIAVLDTQARPRGRTQLRSWKTAQVCTVLLLPLCVWMTGSAVAFDRHHARADAYRSRMDWNGVIREADAALYQGVFDPQIFILRGLAHYAIGNHAKALSDNTDCLRYHPYLVNALNNLGMVYNATGAFEESLEVLDKLLELNPTHVESFYHLGVAYQGLQRFGEAILAFEQGILRNPDQKEFRYALAVAYEKSGDLNQAIAQYTILLSDDQQDSRAFHKMGLLYKTQHRLNLAAQMFTRALQEDPGYLPALLSLGDIYSLKGDPKSAAVSYRTFIDNWKGDPRALNLLKERLASLTSR